jgi:hypothetical protein
MKPFKVSPASGLSKSYVNAKGKLILFEAPSVKFYRITKSILQELPASVLAMVVGMFFTQLYLLFNIFQAMQSSANMKGITVSLFMFTMLGVFICIAFKLGWSLVCEKEEALQKASQLKKARDLQKKRG